VAGFDTSRVETERSSVKESSCAAFADETSAILSPAFILGGESWLSVKFNNSKQLRLLLPRRSFQVIICVNSCKSMDSIIRVICVIRVLSFCAFTLLEVQSTVELGDKQIIM
jgi:hypothetical protein